jgi:hypothetical protein|nr:MAG TPA: hypothetical protein [Caudoviricetes sp.]
MTREEYENAKIELINNLESELERLSDAANVSYDSEEDIENIIDKAECDLELIKSQIRDIEDALSELRKMRNARIEE